MNKGLVSIIIPTHNRAKMVQRAIQSVFQQTYRNVEVIVVANGCVDDTSKIINDCIKKYKKIKFLEYQESLGGAEARNKGIHIAQGEYIAFLDDDDEWIETKLEKQVNILKKYDFCIVGSNYYEISQSSIKERKFKEIVSFYDMNFENILGSYTFCMTKKEYIQGLIINKNLKANQDYDLWLKILQKTKKDAYIIQEYLSKYYQHSEKISTNYKNKIDAQKKFLTYWEKNLTKNGIRYQQMKLLFFQFMDTKNSLFYLQKIPFIFFAIFHSPYRYDWKKYYVYINFLRYLR